MVRNHRVDYLLYDDARRRAEKSHEKIETN
jgi:hypothetical protein